MVVNYFAHEYHGERTAVNTVAVVQATQGAEPSRRPAFGPPWCASSMDERAGRSACKMTVQRIRDLEDIAHDPVLGDGEDRSARIGVDGDDSADVLHPCKVLNRPGDAHRQVQLAGARGLAGLAELAALGKPAGIGDRARAAENRTDRLRQLPEAFDVRLLADAAADSQDELGRRHIDIVGGARLDETATHQACSRGRCREACDRRTRARFRWLEYTGAQREDDDFPGWKVHLDVDFLAVAAACRDQRTLLVAETKDVGREAMVAFRRHGGRIAEGVDAVRQENQRGLARLYQGTHCGFIGIGIELTGGELHGEDFIDAGDTHTRNRPFRLGAQHGHRDALLGNAPGRLCGPHELQRHGADLTAPVLRDDQNAAHEALPASSLMICASRAACSSTLPSIISARPLSGTYMRRTRECEPPSPTSPGATARSSNDSTSIGFAAACLMLRKDAYRGVLIPSWIVSTAGHSICISCSTPPSSSRRNTALLPPAVYARCVRTAACGQSRKAAVAIPVDANAWSDDCTPANSMSGFSLRATAARSRATAIESEPSIASSHTRIALSAPLARHLRRDSSASAAPTHTTTTSTGAAPASLIFIASSSE